ncbi:hypothetical protein GUITHDRAFT_110048 [Guillardia theta CCMP2712]|uniref:Uncharacterized protein n=1 Tax=Guillardia theta (strain CCMP2712) TaxID=905079 RepID=L1J761_GUITC|nr:hypothetical protein GUITHDRAFT_110048 [Guillardia theta CCMP2712]EKX43939.1 hypothetical protein GUITHDRAFT_110048 [Guillardia theta CCMP2712]|eukprot:XP_005830919.1 hypothetical protein GUITHDRAFT_110048 [Guillardia theta CCMP2712]
MCREALEDAVDNLVAANIEEIDAFLHDGEASSPWRVSAARGYDAAHDFTHPEVEHMVGDAIAKRLSSLPREIFVWVGKTMVCMGRMSPQCRCRHLDVRKGDVRSRADDSVAFCMAWVALAKFRMLDSVKSHKRHDGSGRGATEKHGRKRDVHILDPMCGVGTFLCATAVVANKLKFGLEVIGCDAEQVSIDVAKGNLTWLADDINFPLDLHVCDLREEQASSFDVSCSNQSAPHFLLALPVDGQ